MVPHVHIGSAIPIGVILHAPTEQFVGLRTVEDRAALRSIAADVDVELLARYLEAYRAAVSADTSAGPLALGAPSERFHWLTAPRSDVIQAGSVHEGICADPQRELDQLFAMFVRSDDVRATT